MSFVYDVCVLFTNIRFNLQPHIHVHYTIHYTLSTHPATHGKRFSVCYCCDVSPTDPFDFSFLSFFGGSFRTFSIFFFFFFWIHGACIILACRSCQQCCHCSCYWHSNEYVNVACRRLFSPNRNDKQCEWSRFEVQKSAGSTFLII